MFSHITVGCSDLARATAFYNALLAPLGLQQRAVIPDGGPACACWHIPGNPLPRFFVFMPFNAQAASAGNGSMTAFLAPSTTAVDQAYASALQLGGADEGTPGLREHYAKGYYGAYLRDPDGNKIHLVYRGDLT